MREWRRADTAMLCGFCRHRTIAEGEPMLVVRLPTVKREQIRCVDCNGPAPPDLPALPVLEDPREKISGFAALRTLELKRTRRGLRDFVQRNWQDTDDRD